MDKKDYSKLQQLLDKLKELVKCPICLECIKDVVELECSHKYCRDCYTTFRATSKVGHCPLCKYEIGRRSIIYQDGLVSELGKFVNLADGSLSDKVDSSFKLKGIKQWRTFKAPPTRAAIPNESNINAFNKLMKPSALKSMKRTSNKKCKQVNDTQYRILDFDDRTNKEVVLRWLSDTRNKFDRLTQTQDILSNGNETPLSADIPSVSQAFKRRYHKEGHPITFRSRAKSLDIEVKKVDVKKKRHSDGYTNILDNYDIEEFTEEEEVVKRAKENVIVNLIENEILDKLEQEVIKKSATDAKRSKQLVESVDISQNSSTGWNRITETSKSMNIRNKKPKQLDIVFQSLESTAKRNIAINISTDPITKPSSRVCHDEDHTEEKIDKSPGPEMKKKDDSRCYNLDDMEKYFEVNLKTRKKSNEEKQNLSSVERCNLGIAIAEKCQSYSESPPKMSLVEDKLCCDAEEVYLLPTQPLSNGILQNPVSYFGEFDLHTRNVHSSNNLKLLNIISIFANKLSQNDSAMLEKMEIAYLKSCIEKLIELEQKKSSNLTINKATQTDNGFYRDIETQTVWLLKSVGVQSVVPTDQPNKSNRRTDEMIPPHVNLRLDIGTQTVNVLKSVAVQSVVTSRNNAVQSEHFFCDKCSLLQELKHNMSCGENNVKEIETEAFSGSLGDFNFKTAEIAKDILCNKEGSSKIQATSPPKVVQNPIPCEPSTSEGDNIPNSLLVCSMSSDKPKQIRKKLSYVQGPSKRRRNVLDSDSDEEIKPIMKRNRFVRSDLSIEFESQGNTEPVRVPSSTNESIDYDNYLAEVMKKYDDGELFMDKTPEQKFPSTQKTESHCDHINKQIHRNIENLAANKKRSCSDESLKRVLVKNSESCDVIGKTESPVAAPKKIKIGTDEVNDDYTCNILPSPICKEFNNDFDDVIVEDIHKPKTSEIKIIENILIQKSKNGDDSPFSDDDIVETTPQKSKSYHQLNESIRSNRKPVNNDDAFDDDFGLDIEVLPPPPDFQDPVEQTSLMKELSSHNNDTVRISVGESCPKENLRTSQTPQKYLVNNDSLTADFSQFITIRKKGDITQADQVKAPKRITNAVVEHSTPLSVRNNDRETMEFSPITATGNILNVLQKSLSSSPLTNTLRQSGNLSILTSNPKQKSIWNYIKTSQAEKENVPKTRIKPCIACTRLSKDQIMCISQMTNKKLATYNATFDSSVTHMIVSVDEHNCIKDYTIKSVAAVAAGIWVLRFDWVQDCLASNSIIQEEPYEVLDSSGLPGPRKSRLTRKDNPLFKGYKFHCASPFYSSTQQDIEDIIRLLGGKVVSRLADICQQDGRIGLIIAEVKASQDLEVYEHYLDEYRVPTVDIEWFSKSVGRYQLISIRPYVWCSDDRLEELNYPEFLVEHVSSASEYM